MNRMEDLMLLMLLFEANDLDISEYEDYISYIEENLYDLFNHEIADYIKNNLLMVAGDQKHYLDIIKYLCMRYLMFNDKESGTCKFLRTCSVDEAIYLFETNDHFAYVLIKNYFDTFNQEETFEKDDEIAIRTKYDSTVSVKTLSQMIRDSIEIIYSLFDNIPGKPLNPDDGLLAITAGFAVLNGTNEVFVNAADILRKYEKFVPRVVYGDVCACINSKNERKQAKSRVHQLVRNAIISEDYMWPEDIEDCYELLKYYRYANFIRNEKGYQSRLSSKNLAKVRKINPLWILDDSGYFNKR